MRRTPYRLPHQSGGEGDGRLDYGTGWRWSTRLQVTASCCSRDSRRVDVDGTRRLVQAARRAGDPHLVYVSIVGVDRIPLAYYRAKVDAERDVALSGLPWTTLRATQFHEFTADLLARLTRLPVCRRRTDGASSPSTCARSPTASWLPPTSGRPVGCPTSAAPRC